MNVVTDALSLHCQRNLFTAAARVSSISASNAQSYKNGMRTHTCLEQYYSYGLGRIQRPRSAPGVIDLGLKAFTHTA